MCECQWQGDYTNNINSSSLIHFFLNEELNKMYVIKNLIREKFINFLNRYNVITMKTWNWGQYTAYNMKCAICQQLFSTKKPTLNRSRWRRCDLNTYQLNWFKWNDKVWKNLLSMKKNYDEKKRKFYQFFKWRKFNCQNLNKR